MAFADNLAALPAADLLARIELTRADGVVETIENRPGSAGSVRLYAWLARQYGGIDAAAAEEGLRLYAEHTLDARQHPGKHPNIDRLLGVLASGRVWQVRLEEA
ncbi:MAG: DUF2322 family protein [Betaproteobacteria bacterium]|nr:DUF2322 family protein [Betaproteobacteria bacterium]